MSGESHRQQRRKFPTIWHLICFAIITFLAFTGHVSLQDTAIILLSTLYLLLLSTYSFPPPPNPAPNAAPIFPANWNRILPLYALFTGVTGLLLPTIYILHGIYVAGDDNGVAAAAPHIFLLAAQVAMEGVTFAVGFSGPVWAFIPVFYNSWRMPAVVEWARSEMMTSDRGGSHLGRVYFGRGLALVNLGLWSFNLFGFLLPVFLPRALKRYYSATNAGTAGNKVE